MKRVVPFTCASIVALGLAACGGAPRGGMERDRDESMVVAMRADGTSVAVRPGRDPNGAYIQATEFKAKGDCATAIKLLRPVARLGPGYENAQTALGDCLLESAETRDEGATWITRAADAGWPEAQASLAFYFGGESAAHNGEEAAYWLALYDANPNKARVGFQPPDLKVIAAVRAALTEAEKAAGAKRAAGWQQKLWIPPAPAEGDAPGLRPEGRERGGFRGPPPL
jgi:TPR repeat protein